MNISISDPATWPLLLTKDEVATIVRRSVKTVMRRVRLGLMPPPGSDGLFYRDEIERYARGRKRDFEKSSLSLVARGKR